MGGRAFAGSWIQSQGSRILLVSLVQVPESRILIQEQASVVGPFPPPTLLPVSSCQPHFSPLSTFHSFLSISFWQKSFTCLPCHFSLLSCSSHKECWQLPKIAKISDPLTILTSIVAQLNHMHKSLNNAGEN